jgi:hypothetical protein
MIEKMFTDRTHSAEERRRSASTICRRRWERVYPEQYRISSGAPKHCALRSEDRTFDRKPSGSITMSDEPAKARVHAFFEK